MQISECKEKSKGLRLVFDLEANGLEPDTIWCVVIRNIDTNKEFIWTHKHGSAKLRWFLNNSLGKADELIGHNIIGYDLPVLERLASWRPEPASRITDTLVLSRLEHPDRPAGHSLRAWGERLGLAKPGHEDWTQFSSEMLERCRGDVALNCLVYQELARVWEQFGESPELEHDIARIITEQESNGFFFDSDSAMRYLHVLNGLVADIDRRIGFPNYKETVPGREVRTPFRMDGQVKSDIKKYLGIAGFGDGANDCDVVGPFCKVSYTEFNPESTHHLKEWLLEKGWAPDKHTPKGAPQLTDSSLRKMGTTGEKLIKRGVYVHRLRQIQGLLDRLRSDGRVGAGANPCGTPTGRMRHRNVVNIPKVSTYSKGHSKAGQLLWHGAEEEQRIPFGTELRSLFSVPPTRVLVGYDAKGLELRILAHYIGDRSYIEELLHGDAHTFTQQAAGLPDRDSAKTFIYAFVYGAGNAKLGSIVGGGYLDGKRIAEKFYQTIPGLRRLVDGVQRAAKRGYLIGLDGRHLKLRDEHKALNTLIQGGGAVCMKKITQILDRKIDKSKCMKVCDMHDEAQIECDPEYVEKLTELIHESFVECTQHFNLRIPLEADVKTGKNWAETH